MLSKHYAPGISFMCNHFPLRFHISFYQFSEGLIPTLTRVMIMIQVQPHQAHQSQQVQQCVTQTAERRSKNYQ
jgi:hypothetical protein